MIGILLGAKRKWVEVASARGVEVEGVSLRPNAILTTLDIEVSAAPRVPFLQVMWHFEFDGGRRGMLPRSTPLWVALGLRLGKFFGGTITLEASGPEDKVVSYNFPTPRASNAPEHGEEWDAFQQELWELQPLTDKELDAAKKLAYYEADE